MVCKKCGKDIPDGAPFCCWCGKPQIRQAEVKHRRARGTGSICKDSRNHKNPYVARAVPLVIGGRGTYIGSFPTKKEAQAALEKYESGRLSALYNADIHDIFKMWSANHFNNVSQSSAAGYKAAYNSIKELSKKKMRDIKTVDFQRCIDKQAEAGASTSKLNKIKILCSQICKYAMQNDIIDKNYAEFIVLPKAEKKEKSTFTNDEINTLWEHTDDKRVQMVLVMIYTGFRIGEIAALRPEDVYDKYMIGGEKTEAGKNRIVPFPQKIPEIKSFVTSWVADCHTDTLLGMSARDLRKKQFYPCLAELGMIAPAVKSKTTGKMEYKNPRLTPHSTRHTFASLSALAGMPPEILQKIIGHANYETTADIYVHKDIDALISGMELIRK